MTGSVQQAAIAQAQQQQNAGAGGAPVSSIPDYAKEIAQPNVALARQNSNIVDDIKAAAIEQDRQQQAQLAQAAQQDAMERQQIHEDGFARGQQEEQMTQSIRDRAALEEYMRARDGYTNPVIMTEPGEMPEEQYQMQLMNEAQQGRVPQSIMDALRYQ